IALLAWAVRSGLLPVSFSIPAYATAPALEGAYKLQIDRLAQLTLDADARGYLATNNPEDVQPFSPPEILEAKIEELPHSYLMVTGRSHHFKSRVWAFEASPQVGRARVNRDR